LAHCEGVLVIATGLSVNQDHAVRCGRSNEAAFGETALSGVVVDDAAEPLQPSAHGEELRYEAIGDSITAGYAVMDSPGSPEGVTLENSDVFQTYERFLADSWSTSDWHVAAKSGISVTDYGGEVVMQERWGCRTFSWVPCPGTWDFQSWQADVVTINLGTNDFIFGTPTGTQFKEAYRQLVTLVRSRYPAALIACLAPVIYSCFGQHDTKWQIAVESIKALVHEFQAEGDARVRFYSTGTPDSPWLICAEDYSDYTHPTTRGNQKLAAGLLPTLTSDIRLYFPEKCLGSGPKCEVGNPVASTTEPLQTTSPTAPSPIEVVSSRTTPASTTEYQPRQTSRTTPTPPSSTSIDEVACANTLYGQCGGRAFAGDPCCPSGTICTETNEWWSGCMPATGMSVSGCGNAYYSMCGGTGFTGETCCPEGASCVVTSSWFSMCQPASAALLVSPRKKFLASAGSVLLHTSSITQRVQSPSEEDPFDVESGERGEL